MNPSNLFKNKKILIPCIIFVIIYALFFAEKKEDNNLNDLDQNVKTYVHSDFINKRYRLNSYHEVKFINNNTYNIYQKLEGSSNFSCGGSGSWELDSLHIILHRNDSNCDETRKMAKKYAISPLFN